MENSSDKAAQSATMDNLFEMLDKLTDAVGPSQRYRCLELALDSFEFDTAQEAVDAAVLFENYIRGSKHGS